MARQWKDGDWTEDDVVERDERDKVEVREVEAREDEVREDDKMLEVRRQVPGEPYEGAATIELLETTDVEDIQALSDAIVELIQGAAYDDMTWAEIDVALRRTSHAIRLNWAATGTVEPAPVEPAADAERARDEQPRWGEQPITPGPSGYTV